MTFLAVARATWQRVLYGDETRAKLQTPPQIQQQLTDAVNYVAEFNTAGRQSGIIDRGEPIRITNLANEQDGTDVYKTRDMFHGTINNVQAAQFPHSISVTAVGPLWNLRRVRQDADLNLTGKTDIQAVKLILDYCDIEYESSDIKGEGAPYGILGPIQKVLWKRGQTGADIIQELDRVFGFATVERGDGKVIRFPYSYAPSDYSDTIYPGSAPVAKRFIVGQPGLAFYELERSRGGVDEIINFWRVNGLSWQGAEDTPYANCQYQIFAEGIAEHALLGPDIYQGDEFSSELIQTEALAKKIAKRLMHWYNRAPDTVRIGGGNDPRVMVGDVIGVRSTTHGIDLGETAKYLVTSSTREGDFMTLDCVGGNTGALGTITSGIEVCCGHQREDGTCTDEGTDPGTPDLNDPTIPGVGDLGECDPLEDVTCIPGGDDEDADPNYIDPVIGCTDTGTLVACDPDSEEYDDCIESIMDNTCSGFPGGDAFCLISPTSSTNWFLKEETDSGCDCTVLVPWRVSGQSPRWRKNAFGTIDAVGIIGGGGGGGHITLSTEVDPAVQNITNDMMLGAPLITSISMDVQFNRPGGIVSVSFPRYNGTLILSGGTGGSGMTLHGSPGLSLTIPSAGPKIVGVNMRTENENALWVGNTPPNESHGGLSRNNGGYCEDCIPPGLGEVVTFTFSTDMTYQRGWGRSVYQGSNGGGHIQHNDFLVEGHVFPGEPSDPLIECGENHDGHKVQIQMSCPNAGTWAEPAIIIANLKFGVGACESNPDYFPPVADNQT